MDTKKKIMQEYINLSLEKRTTKISVRQLCDNIGISRTTFYKYFKDCSDIIENVFMEEVLEPMDALLKNGVEGHTVLENWYLGFYKNKDFYILAIREDGQNSLFFTIVNTLTEYNKKIYGRVYSGDDLEYYSYKFAATQAMLMRKWLIEGMKVSHKKMAEYFFNSDLFDGRVNIF